MDELNTVNSSTTENISKCCKCNDSPGDFILDSCMHSLCNYCVATCLELRDMYNCPRCLTKSKISTNIYLPILNRQSVERCSWCEVGNEENFATGYCKECDIHLCPECIRGHCRMPQFRSHHIQTNTEADGHTLRNCDSHPNEALDIYCETCEKLTCRDCQLSLHKEHKHQWIGEKAREMNNNLTRLHEQISSQLELFHNNTTKLEENQQKLTANIQSTKQHLQSYLTQLQQNIQEYFQKLESDLDKEADFRQQKLSEINKEINRSSEILQHCFLLLNKLQSIREPSLLIQVTPKFIQNVTTIFTKFQSNYESSFEKYFQLEYTECSFHSGNSLKSTSDLSENIGQVKFGELQPKPTSVPCKVEQLQQIMSIGGHSNSNRYRRQFETQQHTSNVLNQWPIHRELCSVCNDGGFVICCARCNQLYHQACHVPRLTSLPSGSDWLCTICSSKHLTLSSSGAGGHNSSADHNSSSSSTSTRLTKRERKIVASIFLELLCYHDWTIFISDSLDSMDCTTTILSNTSNLHSTVGGAAVISGSSVVGSNGIDMTHNHQNLDWDRIRLNIESKYYCSIDQFVTDLRTVFQSTMDKYQNSSVKFRVTKFQEKLDSLMDKFN